MSQFAVIRSNNIAGYIEDNSKGIVTIFLNSGGCCVLLAETIMATLKEYQEEDLDNLFSKYVWNCCDDESATITFGSGSVYENVNSCPSYKPIEPPKPKKPKF